MNLAGSPPYARRGRLIPMLALLAVLVFLAAAMIDYAEARYVSAVQRGDAHTAAVFSLMMYTLGALGFIAVVDQSLWLMVPEGLGFYVGTLLAVRPTLHG